MMANGAVAEKAAKNTDKTPKKRRMRSDNQNPHTVVSMLYELCAIQRERRLQSETMQLILAAYNIEIGIVLETEQPGVDSAPTE